jgi:hypothetical protein
MSELTLAQRVRLAQRSYALLRARMLAIRRRADGRQDPAAAESAAHDGAHGAVITQPGGCPCHERESSSS